MEAAANGKPFSPGDVAVPKMVTEEGVATNKLIRASGKEAGEPELTARKLRTETVIMGPLAIIYLRNNILFRVISGAHA